MEHEALGPFFLARRLGAGGMGEVYLAFGPIPPSRAGGLCVVKMMKKDLMAHEQIVRRFEDEARLLAALRHKNIGALYDAGYVNDVPFMSLEFISGVTVKELLRLPSLPRQVRAHVAMSLLGALAAAHEAKGSDGRALSVVHRDVSPQNVMIDANGVVKLIDFGIAHFTRKSAQTMPGQFVGKMKYAPPEQLLGDDVDARADVFAAGVLITELFAGQRFYAKLSDEEAARAALNEQWSSASLDSIEAGVGEVLRRATARDPADRYASARVFERALAQALAAIEPSIETGSDASSDAGSDAGSDASSDASSDHAMRDFLRAHLPDELRRLELVEEEAILSARTFTQHRSAEDGDKTMVSVVDHTPPNATASSSAPGAVLEDLPTDKELIRPDVSTVISDSSPQQAPTRAGKSPARDGAPSGTYPPRVSASPDARTLVRKPPEPTTVTPGRNRNGPTTESDADPTLATPLAPPLATPIVVARSAPDPPSASRKRTWIAAAVALVAVLGVAWLARDALLRPPRDVVDAGAQAVVVVDAGVIVSALVDVGTIDAGSPVVDAGAPAWTGAAIVDAGAQATIVDAGSMRIKKIKAPPSEGSALQQSLKKARERCKGVPACAGLPATVDAEAPLDDLLELRQRARACLEACGQ